MSHTRPDPRSPGGSEAQQDPSFERDPDLKPARQETDKDHQMRYHPGSDQPDPNLRENPRGNPKRATGLHPIIRATSTDDDALTAPVPRQDDPLEDTPGEAENPQNDFEDEDFIEDNLLDEQRDTNH